MLVGQPMVISQSSFPVFLQNSLNL